MDDERLRLNTLNRFVKRSPHLVLQEYSHCEVPAGCGGYVFRWHDPRAGRPVPREVEPQRVLRGGSWADGPEACTVSFRMSRPPEHSDTPTVGFRLVRVERLP